jgi:hypothetical protein
MSTDPISTRKSLALSHAVEIELLEEPFELLDVPKEPFKELSVERSELSPLMPLSHQQSR